MLRSWADAKLIPAQTSSNHKARGPRSLRFVLVGLALLSF